MKICIDPGHGGYDPGAVNHNVGVTEKSLALKIAALLGGELASRGYDVLILLSHLDLGLRSQIMKRPICSFQFTLMRRQIRRRRGLKHGIMKVPGSPNVWRLLCKGN